MSKPDLDYIFDVTSKKMPKVSIGMPVYNGEKYIREALDSLLSQTFTCFELIISDNASTDGTQVICHDYAVQDKRIRYIRQQENLGAAANFKIVLDEAVGEYFMWAACDDIRSPDFIEVNLAFLRANPTYLGSTSPVKFRGCDFNEIAMGDASLDSENDHDRILQSFQYWHANGRFYSLFRLEAIVDWKHIMTSFLGSDWSLICYLARNGKLKRLNDGWVERGKDGESNTTDIFANYRSSWIDWLIPFRKLSFDTWGYMVGARPSQKIRLLWRILRLNFQGFYYQFFVMVHRRKSAN
ncbi:MAG: glycosyltransferase family 2 protein [Geobacteraceae bacterium]